MKKHSVMEKQKNSKDLQKESRKNLQAAFVQKLKSNAAVNQEFTSEEPAKEDNSAEVQQWKQEAKGAKKREDKAREELSTERKEHRRTKLKLDEKSQKLFEAEKEKAISIEDKHNAEKRTSELEQKLLKAEEELRVLQNWEVRRQKAEGVRLDLVDDTAEGVTQEQPVEFTHKIRELQSKLESELQAKRELKVERDDQKQLIQRLSKPNISTLLTMLQSSLNLHTIDHYQPIHRIAEQVRKLSLQKKRPTWYKESDPVIKQRLEQSRVEDFGYISTRNDAWFFCNLMNVQCELDLNFVEPQADMPAKVVMVDGVAYLQEVFKSDAMFRDYIARQNILTRKSQINTPALEQDPHPHFGNFNVLFVGGRLPKDYRNRFEKHGLTSSFFNPYEESLDFLDGRIDDADIVVVSTSSIPNSVMQHFNKNDQKIEMIEHDSVERVIARIRFAGIRIGLMDMYTSKNAVAVNA